MNEESDNVKLYKKIADIAAYGREPCTRLHGRIPWRASNLHRVGRGFPNAQELSFFDGTSDSAFATALSFALI